MQTQTHEVTATYLYSGFPDYWQGNGRRWDDDAGCLFAYYTNETTGHDLIDEWMQDWLGGGDCDSMPEIAESDVRAALAGMFTVPLDQPIFPDTNKQDEDDDAGESPFAIVLLEAVGS